MEMKMKIPKLCNEFIWWDVRREHRRAHKNPCDDSAESSAAEQHFRLKLLFYFCPFAYLKKWFFSHSFFFSIIKHFVFAGTQSMRAITLLQFLLRLFVFVLLSTERKTIWNVHEWTINEAINKQQNENEEEENEDEELEHTCYVYVFVLAGSLMTFYHFQSIILRVAWNGFLIALCQCNAHELVFILQIAKKFHRMQWKKTKYVFWPSKSASTSNTNPIEVVARVHRAHAQMSNGKQFCFSCFRWLLM